MQMFIENVARQLGMPSSAVPPPLPPLPPPIYGASDPPLSSPLAHAYGVSASAHASRDNSASSSAHASPNIEDTFASAIGMENPKETLQRIVKVFLVRMRIEPQVVGEASPLIWMMNFLLIDIKHVGDVAGSWCATV
uniref:Uncharacterized protein n=1 Tax=Arundo donax TaxID=35708 RepID=A0A0A8XNZ6_ARUDO